MPKYKEGDRVVLVRKILPYLDNPEFDPQPGTHGTILYYWDSVYDVEFDGYEGTYGVYANKLRPEPITPKEEG